MIDALSYLLYQPSFKLINDEVLDDYLMDLYNRISLYHKQIVNNFKTNHEIIDLPKICHPELLSLYNASLKQPEPLARCIFLFRIIEYKYHIIDQQPSLRLPEYVNLLYKDSKTHRFIPLDIICDYDNEPKINLISRWRTKARRIESRWRQLNKNIGETIYNEGRCGVAHAGRSNQRIIFHDYTSDYKLIEEINIFLELICRFIIEIENPELKKIIKLRNRRKEYKMSKNPPVEKL